MFKVKIKWKKSRIGPKLCPNFIVRHFRQCVNTNKSQPAAVKRFGQIVCIQNDPFIVRFSHKSIHSVRIFYQRKCLFDEKYYWFTFFQSFYLHNCIFCAEEIKILCHIIGNEKKNCPFHSPPRASVDFEMISSSLFADNDFQSRNRIKNVFCSTLIKVKLAPFDFEHIICFEHNEKKSSTQNVSTSVLSLLLLLLLLKDIILLYFEYVESKVI